jgi:hypothetical protein
MSSAPDIILDAPQLVIGGADLTQAAVPTIAPDTRVDVAGSAYVWHEEGTDPIYLDDLRPDSPTIAMLDSTSSVAQECVALSLDTQGRVVLVNVCDMSGGPSDPTETYSRDVGRWSSCIPSTAASCQGTYTTTVEVESPSCTGSWNTASASCSGIAEPFKVDWNGDPFIWTDGIVYNGDTLLQEADCVTQNPRVAHDLTAGDNMDFDASSTDDACMVFDDGDPWSNLTMYYEVSVLSNTWQRIRLSDTSPPTGLIFGIRNAGPAYASVSCDTL